MRSNVSRFSARPSSPLRRLLLHTLGLGVAASLIAAPLSASASTNSAPAIGDDYYSVLMNGSITVFWADVLSSATDADGDALELASASGLAAGSLGQISNSSVLGFTYTPAPATFSHESIDYTVKDSSGAVSNPASIIFDTYDEVGTFDTIPDMRDDDYDAVSGEALVVLAAKGLLGNDRISTTTDIIEPFLTVAHTTKPAHGTLTLDGDEGGFTYTPTDGYVGADSFRYRGYDLLDELFSDYATVSFDVKPAPPVTGVVFTAPVAAVVGTASTVTAQIGKASTSAKLSDVTVSLLIDYAPVGSGKTDATGRATISFTYPAAGPHTMTVTAGAPVVSSSQPFTALSKPVVSTPKPTVPAALVNSVGVVVPSGKPGQVVNLVSTIGSGNGVKAGTAIAVFIGEEKVATGLTDATGTAKIPVKLPAVAGKYTVRVAAGGKSVTKTIKLGTVVTGKIAKPKKVTAKKTQTIKGSFGTKAGKVTLKITDPRGKVTTKTVKLNSKGTFSYKYKTGKKGSYKVTVSYKANAKYYGAKSYTARFTVK